MPILGHALVGIATAHVFEAVNQDAQPRRTLTRALWVPALVLLAYVPDIATQFGLLLGFSDPKIAAHSIVFACVVGTVLGRIWARAGAGRAVPLTALAIGSILTHDLLDLLQSNDRAPFWPFSDLIVAPGWLSYRNRVFTELLVFGTPFAGYEAIRVYRRLRANGPAFLRDVRWIGWAAVGLIVFGVMEFRELRRDRGIQLRNAQRLLRSGDYQAAISAANDADRWPVGTQGATADLVRGEAHAGLGNLALAEQFLLSAHRRDPESFWALADVAEYYASHGTAEERQRRSAPYIEQLRSRFTQHPNYPRVSKRLERMVAAGD